jgi:hypothetical protein
MNSSGRTGGLVQWVVPFGNPWISACLRLPMAYRSLLRPSSPVGTKAFTVLHLVA